MLEVGLIISELNLMIAKNQSQINLISAIKKVAYTLWKVRKIKYYISVFTVLCSKNYKICEKARKCDS